MNPKDWMSQTDDERPLTKICLHGSQDDETVVVVMHKPNDGKFQIW